MSMSRNARPIRKTGHSKQKLAALAFLFDSRFGTGLLSDTHMLRSFRIRSPLAQTSVCILMLAFGTPFAALPAQAMILHHDKNDRKIVEAMEMEWRQAQVANDVSTMNKLLADDYIGISANGTIQTKTELLAQHRSGTLRIVQLNITDMKVRVYGDTAVVTSRAELEGSNGESDISGKYRYTRVYNRRFGEWKIVSFETSRMHDADARAKHL